VICAAALLYASPFFPDVDGASERARFYTTAALAEEGTYRVESIVRRWGMVDGLVCVDEGRARPCENATDPVVSQEAPGTSLLGVPGYAAYVYFATRDGGRADRVTALRVCRTTATIAPLLFFLFWLHRFVTRSGASRSIAEGAFFSVALGSSMYGYGILFVGHATSAAAAFGSFMIAYAARRNPDQKPQLAFLAGFLAAAVPLFEMGAVIVVPILLVNAALAMPKKHLPWVLAGTVLPLAILIHHQSAAFDALPFLPADRVPAGLSFQALIDLLIDRTTGLFPLTPILLFSIVGFGRLVRAPGTRMDGAVALASVLATLLWTAATPDWRGGWTIGPRHLVVVLPFIGWAAIPGISLLAERFPRIADVVALGTTAIAIGATGLISVYYPHLPPELNRPLVQLLGVLTGHDYAPDNVMNLWGVWGSASMFPLFALWTFAVGWAAWQPPLPLVDRVSIVAGAALVGGFILGPLLSAPEADREVMDAVAFVTRGWQPDGHDEAAGLARHLAASGDSTPEGYAHLASLYEEEGRDEEAAAARRAGELLSQRLEIIEAREQP